MNYIHQLKTQVATQEKQRQNAQAQIQDFITHLHSDKFKGTDSQGMRKDWISTADVLHRMIELRTELSLIFPSY